MDMQTSTCECKLYIVHEQSIYLSLLHSLLKIVCDAYMYLQNTYMCANKQIDELVDKNE